MSTIYEQALAALNRSTIEDYLPGGKWQGNEYWINNPLRPDDENATNFSINLHNGQYYDLATGDKGNIITLVEQLSGKKRYEIAQEILLHAGHTVDSTYTARKQKSDAKALTIDDIFYPIPPAHVASFERQIESAILKRRQRGVEHLATHIYYDENEQLIGAILRWQEFDIEKNKFKKHMTPHYLRKNGQLAWKQAISDNRPLYNLYLLKKFPTLPVLIVEGEKCADVLVSGYVVVTWMGGSRAVAMTDWTALAHRDVMIWPDHDEAGQSAALTIRKALPHAKILPIEAERPKGWDVADAIQEDRDFDPEQYIKNQLTQLTKTQAIITENNTRQRNFVAVGYTDNEWVFYLRRTRRLHFLRSIGITSQHLLQMEDLEWWEAHGYVTVKGAFLINNIINDLKKEIERCGIFDYPNSTGFNFYQIDGKYYWHDGAKIIDQYGQPMALDSMLPKYIFTEEKSHNHPFYTYHSESVSVGAKYHIFTYFTARNWRFSEGDFSAKLALGWALWSPFCAFFDWRPHLHITAAAGSGKSKLIDYSILPLVAPYALRYSNLTSAAAIRQAVNRRPRGVILEEFEATGKDDKMALNIDAIYELIKAASDNASSRAIKGVPNADAQGRQTPREYDSRATFLLVSIREASQDAALTQRIINLELLKRPTIDDAYLSAERYAMDALETEGKYAVADSFRNLPYLIEQTKLFARKLSVEHHIDDRMTKNFAPLLVFSHFFLHGTQGNILDHAEQYAEYITNYLASLSAEKSMSDAEKCLDIILQSDIISSENERKSAHQIIMERMALVHGEARDVQDRLETHLARMGIMIINAKNPAEAQLAIHTNSQAIKQALRYSSYGKSYASILRRHEACVEEKYRSESKAAVRAATSVESGKIAGVRPQFICLDLKKIITIED